MSFLDTLAADHHMMLVSEYSHEVTITVGENSVTVRGLFDDIFEIVDPETNTRVISTDSRVTVWESDVPFSLRNRGAVVRINGKDYRLRIWEPDNQGGITLYLDK